MTPVNTGWAIIPTNTSVRAKQPSVMLELVFSRALVFTAIITNTFKMMVKGQVMMFSTIMKISSAYAPVAG